MAKYSTNSTEGKCIFCEIANQRIEPRGNGLIYEDDKFMAWLSPFPNTLGFSVVIPKSHQTSDVLELDDELLADFILCAKKVSRMLKRYFSDVGRVGLIMEGTGINHAHIKLFLMHGTEYMKTGEWRQYLSNNSTFFEKYEGYIQSNDGPQADFTELSRMAHQIKKHQ